MALILSLAVVFLLSVIYSLMAITTDRIAENEFDLGFAIRRTFGLFRMLIMCPGPIIFICTFALMQRFRQKEK